MSKSISVVFQAFTEKFEKNVATAGEKLKGFGKTALTAVGGFLVARASVAKFSEEMQKLDRIGKLSDRLKIDPSVLRGLDLAATQSGTTFDAVTKGMQKMAKDMPTMDIFQLADAIKSLPTPNEKIAFAMQAMGEQGAELVNFLELGSEGLKKFIDESNRFQGILTREDIQGVERANDAIDKLQRTWDSFIQLASVKLAPTFEGLAAFFSEFMIHSRVIFDYWNSIQENIQAIFEYFMDIDETIDFSKQPLQREEKKNIQPEITTIAQMPQIQEFAVKGFVDALQFGSAGAFEALNPDRNTTFQKIEDNTRRTAEALDKLASDGAILVEETI